MILVTQIFKIKETLLQPIARRLPRWLSPNFVSAARALLIIPIFMLYRQEQITWLIVVFVFALLTDAFDGVLARIKKTESDLGKLLDPAADKILIIGLLLIIAPSRLSREIFWTTIILESILISLPIVFAPLFAFLFAIRRKLGANIAGKIKMTMQGLAMIILLFGLNNQTYISVSEAIFWLAAFFALLSIILHLALKEEL